MSGFDSEIAAENKGDRHRKTFRKWWTGRSRWFLIGGLALVALIGFEFVVRSDRALWVDGYQGYCQPSEDGRATVGGLALFNSSDRTVKILEVSLLGADGLSLIEARLLPTDDTSGAVNSRPIYPPPTAIWPNWERSVPAVGALVPPMEQPIDEEGNYIPNESRVILQLVVGVERAAGVEDGRAAGVEVVYRSGIRTHRWVTSPSISIPRVECSDDWGDYAFYRW